MNMKKTFCQQVSTFFSSVFKLKKKKKENDNKEKNGKKSSFMKFLFKKKKKRVSEMVTIPRFSSILAKQQQQKQQRKSKKKNESKHQKEPAAAASCKKMKKKKKKNETPPEEEMFLLEHVPKSVLHTLSRSVLGHNIHSHCCLSELDGHDDRPKPVEPDHNDHVFDEEEGHNDSDDPRPVDDDVEHSDQIDEELSTITTVDDVIIDDLFHVEKLVQFILREFMRNEKRVILKKDEFISREEPIDDINELLEFDLSAAATDIEFSEARLHLQGNNNNHENFCHDDNDSDNGESNTIIKEEEIKIDEELKEMNQINSNVDVLVSSNYEEPKVDENGLIEDNYEDVVLQHNTSDYDQEMNILLLIENKKKKKGGKCLQIIKTASKVVAMFSCIWLVSLFM